MMDVRRGGRGSAGKGRIIDAAVGGAEKASCGDARGHLACSLLE